MIGSYSTNHVIAMYSVQAFEEDDGKEYIYKEPKVTGLTEICERLRDLYTLKFGRGTVQLIMDSAQVCVWSLKNLIQILTQYNTEKRDHGLCFYSWVSLSKTKQKA